MTLLVPSVGEQTMLAAFLNKTAPQDLILHLYASNTVPASTDVASTYTEVAGYGYAPITLTASNWTVSGSAPASAVQTQQTFTFTGAAGTVYGYFVTQATSGKLMWAEKFTNSVLVQNNGDQIALTPQFTLN